MLPFLNSRDKYVKSLTVKTSSQTYFTANWFYLQKSYFPLSAESVLARWVRRDTLGRPFDQRALTAHTFPWLLLISRTASKCYKFIHLMASKRGLYDSPTRSSQYLKQKPPYELTYSGSTSGSCLQLVNSSYFDDLFASFKLS